MKKLILIRHGKSSWDLPVSDKQRDLTPKGIENCILVASNVVQYIPKDAIFWSSEATRAHKTALLFLNEWNINSNNLIVKKELYTFDYKALYNQIIGCNDESKTLVLFGHNNAITDFVNKFGSQHIDNVATSGFVAIEFDTNSWKNLSKGTTFAVVFPKKIIPNT